ncbi:MAG: exodeoxyribonuclease VII small subunit [Chloroflexi bacterium]|jgi:exodeoxyribonuclease VII small subunit|nr:exodeoxyribonuclease VII small subunit [Chloroflexota bacterium]MBT7080723.1 exodeoxyribonuclease VII small subunit [Chloroflexota bacterium]
MDTKEPSFEQLLTKLEEVVSKLDAGDLTLEQSLALYEEGMKLSKQCNQLLNAAELKISKLQTAFDETE